MPVTNHIEVIPEDTVRGKIYVIGDVHGEVGALREVLGRLHPDDRLIIVGDLMDRGENDPETPTSAEVLDLVMEYSQAPAGTKPKIHCIQGNHEIDFLNVLAIFERKNATGVFPQEAKSLLTRYIRNGGGWIFAHAQNDAYQTARFGWFRAFSMGVKTPECLAKISEYVDGILNHPTPLDTLLPDIFTYKEWLATMPFVIKIEGTPSAIIAHADLALRDEDLDRRILDGEGFTRQEILYLTNARIASLASADVRNSSSNLVIVGHNIIDEPDQDALNHPALPVRADTNHINIDGGAYFTKGFLLLNLTDKTIDVVGEHITEEGRALLTYACDAIHTHLNTIANEDEPSSKRQKI